MKPEKGQPVFIDNVDVLLTDRIVNHTKDNADREKVDENRTAPNRTHRKEPKQSMVKSKWMMWAAISVLVVAGIIACFIFCRGGCCGKKK